MNAAVARSQRPRLDPAAFPSLGPGQLRPGRDVDAIDDVLPQAVITAREIGHVSATIEEARAKRLGIVVSGGGTLLHVGAPPREYDIRLSMTAIGRVVEQNPEDMTVTCEAGVSLSRLQRSLARSGQRLAIDAARDDRASIGGIVAANATGGLRHGFGLPRDLVLGLTFLDGAGRLVTAGGRVVKNVAGYDLVRLVAGSWGTLGIITELTLRTHPLPVAGATLVFEFVSPAELEAARARLVAEPLPLVALDFAVDAGGGTALWLLAVRIEGSGEEVSDQGDRVCHVVGREPADALGDWESPAHVDAEDGLTLRIAAPPSEIVGVIRGVLQRMKDAGARGAPIRIGGHLGAGVARIHIASAPGDENAAYAQFAVLWAATTPGDGVRTRVIERATPAIKSTHAVWGTEPASLDLMREVKRRFDPDGVLAPGRFVGGL